MSGTRALNRLHVFRSLCSHIQTRWAVGLALVDRLEGVVVLTDREVGALGPIEAGLGISSLTIEAHENALRDTAPTRGSAAADHPAGFGFVSVACLVSGRSGRLVAWPLTTPDEAEDQRAATAGYLVSAGLAPAEAADAAERIPCLGRDELEHLGELMTIMANEARMFGEQWARSERRLDKLRKHGRGRYSRIIGRALPMQHLFSLMDRLSQSESTVYIHGENGTGKELVARELHEYSPRAGSAFIVQNCSALNDNLLESELFGHRRGAFTGAHQDKPGLFDLAHNGTFFLDEIGDMSPALQVKLLRVLQEGTFTPVGGLDVHRVDVRVICATNRDLQKMVRDRTFREDLYYRINVINLNIPALRERKDDIPLLTEFFLEKSMQRAGRPDGQKRLAPDAVELLQQYDWPGNVRELENEVERLVVLTAPLINTIASELLSPHIRNRLLNEPERNIREGVTLPAALERMERSMIHEQLRLNRWNKTKAAEALGISRRNLIRKVKQYDFDRRVTRPKAPPED